jgi:hypothetical protein
MHTAIRMPTAREGKHLTRGRLITDPDELAASGVDLDALAKSGAISGDWARAVKTTEAKAAADSALSEGGEATAEGGEVAGVPATEVSAPAAQAAAKSKGGRPKKADSRGATEPTAKAAGDFAPSRAAAEAGAQEE